MLQCNTRAGASLDRYFEDYVEAEGLRDTDSVKARLKALRAVLGKLPVASLEKPGDILRFKAAYRKGHEVATVNRALAALRAAINWGRFQDPPYLRRRRSTGLGVTIRRKTRRSATAASERRKNRRSWRPARR